MSEFKVIETQEELDRIIQGRLDRQKETLEKQFSDYDQIKARNAELETENGGLKSALEESKQSASKFDETLAELNSKVAGYETANLRTRIALQNGLPFDLADRLVGTNEESIKADAERLASFMGSKTPVAPLKSVEPNVEDSQTNDLKNMLKDLTNKGE